MLRGEDSTFQLPGYEIGGVLVMHIPYRLIIIRYEVSPWEHNPPADQGGF